MASLKFITVLLVCVSAQEAASGEIDFRSVIHGFKGFMSGFQKGLYDDEYFTVPDECFGSDQVNADLLFLYDFVNGRRPPFEIIQFVTTFKSVFLEQMTACGYSSSLYAL